MNPHCANACPEGVRTFIATLSFPKFIKLKACEIYGQLDLKKNYRVSKRKKIICYCIHQAYLYYGETWVDAVDIGAKMDMNKIDANSAVSVRHNYKPGFNHISPTINMPDMAKNYIIRIFGLPEEDGDRAATQLEVIIESDRMLLTGQAKAVTAAYILYYMQTNGYSMNQEDFVASFHLNYTTISPIFLKIGQIAAELTEA